MKPVASPITNNSRRFFIATSNETAKSDYKYVCLRKNKLDVPKHNFFSPKRLFLSKVSVVQPFKSRNFNGRLLDAEWQEPSLDKLFGLARRRDCAMTSTRRDADWSAEVRVGAFSPWRRIHTPVGHIRCIRHTLVFCVFENVDWSCKFPASLPVSYPWQQFFSVSTISPIILQKKLLAPRSGSKM